MSDIVCCEVLCARGYRTPVVGLGLGVDFTFAWDNNKNNNNNNNNKNPHLNFLKRTILWDKEQGVGIRDKGQGIRPKLSSTLKTKSFFMSMIND